MKKQFLVILAAALAMGLSASCDIWPRGPYTTAVSGVTLDKTTLEMTIGDPDVKLTATVVPENATDKTVSWSSDKPEFATVDQEGNVHAVAAGVATITVTTTDGGKTAACTVTVKDYVIIGGLKWAKKNIGAEKETDYGYYFFWGGTVGYVYDSANSKWVKESDGSELPGGFIWSNAPFNNGSAEYDDTYFKSVKDTECPEGILATKNDAAAVYCGAGWRMPTKEDFTALA
ncbi:MAG: Ig-like domain-containing protein, partial [Bacteroidales bacterium]|nr:Ig-like domain-containing protein [Bacteroidales bacterium]